MCIGVVGIVFGLHHSRYYSRCCIKTIWELSPKEAQCVYHFTIHSLGLKNKITWVELWVELDEVIFFEKHILKGLPYWYTHIIVNGHLQFTMTSYCSTISFALLNRNYVCKSMMVFQFKEICFVFICDNKTSYPWIERPLSSYISNNDFILETIKFIHF